MKIRREEKKEHKKVALKVVSRNKNTDAVQ
jgi:hypothetical protein